MAKHVAIALYRYAVMRCKKEEGLKSGAHDYSVFSTIM